MKVLVTGAAGFIGFHLVERLLKEEFEVVGLDNINDYYNVNMKYARLAETGIYAPEETDLSGGKNRKYKEISFGKFVQSIISPEYRFIRLNLEDKATINQLFESEKFDYVVNLAAQAGVRYSIENPDVYIQSNIIGFYNILEACRHHPVKHLVYASSSSVYGANAKIPFSEDDKVDEPVSLYAATKKSNELMAYTYSHLYGIPTTGLRFFTVYGPWGRPDMSPILFAEAISTGKPIKVFNNGEMERDFTYIDDIIEGIVRLILLHPDSTKSYKVCNIEEREEFLSNQDKTKTFHLHQKTNRDYVIYNIGNGSPVKLLSFIKLIEQAIGTKAQKEMMPMQPGDVKKTWANTRKLESIIGYKRKTPIESGVKKFTEWFKSIK